MNYADIVADLRRRILADEFAVGTSLPSEGMLAQEYGVTRSPIRRAMAHLARQSLVESRPRRGWIVQSGHRVQGLDRMQSFTEWALSGGRAPGGTIVARDVVPASVTQAKQLGIRLDDPLLTFTRLRTLDGRPVMIERSVWAPWATPTVETFPDDVLSTTAALADAGIRVTSGTHRIEAVAASTDDAELLSIRRSGPLLQVSRITTTREGRIVELGVDRYRSGTIAFEILAGEGTRTAL